MPRYTYKRLACYSSSFLKHLISLPQVLLGDSISIMADHTTFAHYVGQELPRAFFEAAGVGVDPNPNPLYGWHHGKLCNPCAEHMLTLFQDPFSIRTPTGNPKPGMQLWQLVTTATRSRMRVWRIRTINLLIRDRFCQRLIHWCV